DRAVPAEAPAAGDSARPHGGRRPRDAVRLCRPPREARPADHRPCRERRARRRARGRLERRRAHRRDLCAHRPDLYGRHPGHLLGPGRECEADGGMSRVRALLVVGALIAIAATSAASGEGTQPVLRHPNPVLSQIVVDYQNPIPSSSGSSYALSPAGTLAEIHPAGGYAMLEPDEPPVIKASVLDLRFLQFEKRDDLGGFVPAPTGWLALGNGGKFMGHTIVGTGGPSQIVLYTKNALTGDRVNSYTPLAGMLPSGQVGGPHNCIQCGVTLQIQPGLFSNTGTPANGCFGGCNNGGGTTTTPGKKHHNGGGKNNGGGNGGK